VDDEIDLGDRHSEALDDLALPLGARQLDASAPADDLTAVQDEDLERLLEVPPLSPTLDDGQVDDAEGRLQIGETEEVIQDDLGEGVLLELDHETHPVSIALIAHFADALDALLADELADLRSEAGLVHLVGKLGDHDLFAIGTLNLLDLGPRAHQH